MRVYLDNASTTPLDPAVLHAMLPFMKTHFGNPSSIHQHGRKVKAAIEEARTKVAKIFNASTGEIFFTSSATEANNMILIASIRDLGVKRIVSSLTEHHCVLHTLDYIKSRRLADVVLLKPDSCGNIDPEELDTCLRERPEKTLVSLMHVNNEIGTMIELPEVALICKEHGALFHSDTVQSVGKFPIDLTISGPDFFSGSAHKFFGPKGVGFLYMSMDHAFKPLVHGGGQERNMRSGTENVYGIIGLAKALELASEHMRERKEKILLLRNLFYAGISEMIEDVQINGNFVNRFHYGILNLSIPEYPASDMLTMNLDIAGISVSAGSACSSGVEHGSHVLQAIEAPHGRKAIRFSFSHLNTEEEINYAIRQVGNILKTSQKVF